MRGTIRLGETQRAENGDRRSLTGTTDLIVDDIRRYQDAGLEYLVLSVASKNTDATIDDVRGIAEDVVARI